MFVSVFIIFFINEIISVRYILTSALTEVPNFSWSDKKIS